MNLGTLLIIIYAVFAMVMLLSFKSKNRNCPKCGNRITWSEGFRFFTWSILNTKIGPCPHCQQNIKLNRWPHIAFNIFAILYSAYLLLRLGNIVSIPKFEYEILNIIFIIALVIYAIFTRFETVD
jgi:endogenous inhibitor of DNA gyrase (YacG/DUF329 family)